MEGPSHSHGPWAMRWLSEFRVGFAEDYPDFETPKLNLPDNDGFVDWTKPVLWQVGDLKERYTVITHISLQFFLLSFVAMDTDSYGSPIEAVRERFLRVF